MTLSPETVARLIVAYNDEKITARQLALREALPYDAVRNALREAGVELRVSGFRLTARPDSTQSKRLVDAYQTGTSVATLSADSGFSAKIVKGILREAGVLKIGRPRCSGSASQVQLAGLIAEYNADSAVTVKQLAEREGLKPRLLADTFRSLGVTVRQHHGSTPTIAFDTSLQAQIAAAYRNGAGLSELQRTYSCGITRLYAALAAEGVTLRRRGRPSKPKVRSSFRHPENPERDKKVKSVDLRELIAAGVVLAGPAEFHYKGQTFYGELLPTGKVRRPDGTVQTLGGAVHAETNRWESGYLMWHARTPEGELTSIETIRKRYLAALAEAA